ncbi:hypothetical protein VC33_15825 [Pseudomonas fluorescens]|nr:hypothetical protein VC33_15825 [Pseudomonas fluorescens]
MMEQYDRGVLLEQVWTDPVSVVAPTYGLSDVGLKKLCARLQIPTPMRGYWAKRKAGKRVPPQPQLREYTGPARYLWHHPSVPAPPSKVPVIESVDPRLQAVIEYEQQPSHRIRVAERLTNPHAHVVQTREALLHPVLDQRGMPFPSRRQRALDMKVSAAMQPRALRIADALIKALETRGYPVLMGDRCNVEIFGIQIGLRFFEPTKRSEGSPPPRTLARNERIHWSSISSSQYVPTGQLHVLGDAGYGGKIMDSPHTPVEQQLNKLIIMMVRRAVELLIGREERAIAEVGRRIQRDEALAKKAEQDAERAKLQRLEEDAHHWRRANALREYLVELEKVTFGAGAPTQVQFAYLQWAKAKADWLDPLIHTSEELLDLDIKIPNHYGW